MSETIILGDQSGTVPRLLSERIQEAADRSKLMRRMADLHMNTIWAIEMTAGADTIDFLLRCYRGEEK